jgi:hypothetical protein
MSTEDEWHAFVEGHAAQPPPPPAAETKPSTPPAPKPPLVRPYESPVLKRIEPWILPIAIMLVCVVVTLMMSGHRIFVSHICEPR